MLITTEIGALADQRSSELAERSAVGAWAACAAIWARVFVLAGRGLKRWPELHVQLQRAFSLAMERSIGIDTLLPTESLLADFEAFNIEDDGTPEWNYAIDLIEIITPAISGRSAATCLRTALRVYLEGVFNHLTRGYAVEHGRPISYAETKEYVANDAEWKRAIEFVNAI